MMGWRLTNDRIGIVKGMREVGEIMDVSVLREPAARGSRMAFILNYSLQWVPEQMECGNA